MISAYSVFANLGWRVPTTPIVRVEDEKGATVVYGFEFGGDGINGMRRAGWTKEMIKYGDKITVTYAPLRDGRTIHHDTVARFGAGKVVLRSAPVTGRDNRINVLVNSQAAMN